MKTRERSVQLDTMRAIATIAVVALHAAGPTLYRYGSISMNEWGWANLIDSASRFAVPAFLMLTGALLLSRTDDTFVFLKRRFARLLYPFLFWSILYLVVAVCFHPSGSPISSSDLLIHRLRTGASYHLWYVYTLIGIYLLIPVLQRWTAVAKRRELEYFIGLWVLALLLGNTVLKQYVPDFNLVYFSGYIGYVVLGYYLQRYYFLPSTESLHFVKRRKWTIFAALSMMALGLLITVLGTAWISQERGKFDQTFYEYLSFNVILTASGAMLLAGTLVQLPRWMYQPVSILSRYSYGIYLSHVMVLKLATEAGWYQLPLHPAFNIGLLTLLTVVTATGITYLLNKLPLGNYISG